ncbi:phospholipase [Streptomyces tendae]|uniref:phospholipase n=1 Tax=Streptomyces tendae TaxID=1932 RepID=UPI003713D489
MRRRVLSLVAAALAVPATLMTTSTAHAAPADKASVLSSWTQTTPGSQSAWVTARNNRSDWSAYGFDWSTDYCSSSPDNPFGFPFETACARHDFGYRNYKAMGAFGAAKARLDSAFYADLKRVCAGYSGVKEASCDATAWIYYQAVDKLGSVAPSGVTAG